MSHDILSRAACNSTVSFLCCTHTKKVVASTWQCSSIVGSNFSKQVDEDEDPAAEERSPAAEYRIAGRLVDHSRGVCTCLSAGRPSTHRVWRSPLRTKTVASVFFQLFFSSLELKQPSHEGRSDRRFFFVIRESPVDGECAYCA